MKLRSINAKMISAVLLAGVLILGGISAATYFIGRNIVQTTTQELSQRWIASSSDSVDKWLAGQKELVLGLTRVNLETNPDADTARRTFEKVANDQGLMNIYMGLADGSYIDGSGWAPPAGYDPRVRPWYAQPAESKQLTFTEPYIDAVTGKLVVSVVNPVVRADGSIKGVIGVDITLDELTATVNAIKMGKSGYAYVIDTQGLTIAHPDGEKVTKENLLESSNKSLLAVVQRMVKGTPGSGTYQEGRQKWFIAYAPIPSTNWVMAVTAPYSEINSRVRTLLIWTMVIAVAGITVLAGALLISLRILKPIHVVEQQLAAIAAGGGDLTARLAIGSDDEVGRLARSYNRFLDTLSGIIRDTMGISSQLAAASEELSATSEETASAIDQIAQTIDQVARGTGQQTSAATSSVQSIQRLDESLQQVTAGVQDEARQLASASSAVQRMAQGIQTVENSIEEVGHASGKTAEAARQGEKAVGTTVDGMGRIRQATTEADAFVRQLGEYSHKIGEILAVISDIADQTNLLALNAAIEAARAGEQGKGFAVVAEEVRKLAERSSRAADEIGSLIATIQTGTADAVRAMETGSREVQTGVDLAERARIALREILTLAEDTYQQAERIARDSQAIRGESEGVVQAVTQVAAISQQSAASVEQMGSDSHRVLAAIQEMSAVSEENAAATEEVSASAEEMTASTREVAGGAQSIAALAQQLAELVGKFKV